MKFGKGYCNMRLFVASRITIYILEKVGKDFLDRGKNPLQEYTHECIRRLYGKETSGSVHND